MLERTLKTFPDWTMPSRSIAEAFAKQAIGKRIVVDQDGRFVNYRVVSTRIDDDLSGEMGRVVAMCECIDTLTTLTGETLHDAYFEVVRTHGTLFASYPRLVSWHELSADGRKMYDVLAATLTEKHLHPLHRLVKDYQVVQKCLYQELSANAGDSEDLEIAMRELNVRAQKLVGEN